MSKRKQIKQNIGDKINEFYAPRKLQDPEYNSDDETIAKNRVYESLDYDDNEEIFGGKLSHIRKKNVQLLQEVDPKYIGKISSRHEIGTLDMSDFEESSESETENSGFYVRKLDSDSDVDDNNVCDNDGVDDKQNSKDNVDEIDQNTDFEEGNNYQYIDEDCESEEGGSDYDGGDIMQNVNASIIENDEEGVSSKDNNVKHLDNNKDIQKGESIQNQLIIWEKLLQIRIQSQQVLLKANSLPSSKLFQRFTNNNHIEQEMEKTTKNVENVLSKMLLLQKALINQHPEVKEVSEKRKRVEYGDETDKLTKFGKKLKTDFDSFNSYRNATLSKWYDRTKVLGISGKDAKGQTTFDIIRNIEGVLANKDELLKKSQLHKGGYEIIGAENTANAERLTENYFTNPQCVYYSDIYDDTDFYHTQLRELIEFKANTSINPVEMSKQFTELQKLRNKIKKVVDTRASKGRKIRYAVHNKMVNFMARNDPTDWTDDAKADLFSSLFA